MISRHAVAYVLEQIEDELRFGSSARALSQANFLLAHHSLQNGDSPFQFARVLLLISRALAQLGNVEESLHTSIRARDLLSACSPFQNAEGIRLYIELAEDFAQLGYLNHAKEIGETVTHSIGCAADTLSVEQLADFLRRTAYLMEQCSEFKLAHFLRTFSLLCLHSTMGLESEAALEMLQSPFMNCASELHPALSALQRSLREQLHERQ